MSQKKHISRREFLRTTGSTTLGVGLGLSMPSIFLNKIKAATGENPSEWIRVGLVGCGGQGNGNMRGLVKNAVAVCDVDNEHLMSTKDRLQKSSNRTIDTYKDYRKMLESKGVDAVLIATPDHWHALPAADAMLAGKDVYCEKPLTLTIEEGKVLVALARKHQCVFQTGSQQRSDPKFRKGCELVRSGYIGKIHSVKVGLPGVNYLSKAKPPSVPDSDPPAELDYNFWLGPAPWRPYNKYRVHYLFRFFWDYSGGQMTNWGAHHLDIMQWGLGMDDSGPVEITGIGQFNKDKLYEVPEKFKITYKYANGVEAVCESPAPDGKYGTRFIGDKGSIYVNRGVLESDPEEIAYGKLKEGDVHLYESGSHHKNWLDCIKSRKLPICDVEIGHRSASLCHLGNTSIQVGKTIKWDPVKEQVVGEPVQCKQLGYEYRAPWKLPKV